MMRVSIERLRMWLLVGAALLVLVVAGFLEYARMRTHHFLKDLPSRLGADITRESNGFTWSQSSRGRTVYTIHAAKMVQRKDGKTTLHDVGIVLYGQKQDRADRIYGSEFEYDQKAGVVRAVGEVHLDLQAPAPTDARERSAYAAGHELAGAGHPAAEEHGAGDERMVHVKTSGLVFVQSLGVASTEQEIEFQYRGINGRAKGADYNSDTGITILQSEVRIAGLHDGEPALLTANHAEMDRGKQQIALTHARYFSGEKAGRGAVENDGQVLTAEEATIHLRSEGSVDRVLAGGGVNMERAGGVLRGRTAEVLVSAQNRPVLAHLAGDVNYAQLGTLQELQGRSGNGTAHFNGQGAIESATMEQKAELHLRQRAAGTLPWSERSVWADRIDTRFARTGTQQWMHDATATGSAHLLLLDRSAKGGQGVESSSELRADSLTAQMLFDGHASRLNHVSGSGHTTLERHDANGAADQSEGAALEVSFGPGASAAGSPAGATSVTRAVQSGGVSVTHTAARRASDSAAAPPLHATGAEAVYEADGQSLTVSGHAELSRADSQLRAQTITMRRESGDATAQGAVTMSYRQSGSSEPLHAIAARAEFKHDAGHGTFYGGAGQPARLWQGGSQVEAPIIEFSQGEKILLASGGANGPGLVHTVLIGTGKGAPERPQVMRVTSRTLRYSEGDRRAQFGGGVVLQDADGTVRAAEVIAQLKPAASGPKTSGATGASAPFMGGSVDRVTAHGSVEVMEQGRRASGEQLLYTAGDGKFVMTGTPASPPRVVDEVQGTITGAALEFHAGDNSVMVLGNGKVGEGRRVHTETLVRQP